MYTNCPGECGNAVVLHGGNVANFCCARCWGTWWSHESGGRDPQYPEPVDLGHTGQCDDRQALRVNEDRVVVDNPVLGNIDRMKMIHGLAADPN